MLVFVRSLFTFSSSNHFFFSKFSGKPIQFRSSCIIHPSLGNLISLPSRTHHLKRDHLREVCLIHPGFPNPAHHATSPRTVRRTTHKRPPPLPTTPRWSLTTGAWSPAKRRFSPPARGHAPNAACDRTSSSMGSD